jgi:iron complex outermembrane receptor protein
MLVSLSLHGQTAPSAEPPPVTLDAFTVRADEARQYLVSEQATGTRYAVQVRDIPFPVSVVTSELMKDFQAWSFDDAVGYSSSFSQTAGTGNFILRGIRQTNSGYRNGVRDNGLVSLAFVDRIEIIKGANAAIYGQTEPSGLRNVVTLRPRNERAYALRVTAGSGAYRRATVSANDVSSDGRLSARLDGFYERDRLRSSAFAENEVYGAYAALDYAFRPATKLFFAIERTSSDVNDVIPQPILVGPPTAARPGGDPLGVLGIDPVPGFEGFAFINVAGPDSFNRIESTVIDAILTHRFNRTFSLRLVNVWWERDQRIASFSNSPIVQTFGPMARRLNPTRAYVDRPIQTNLISQVDLLSEFSLGPTKHKLLVTYDRQDYRIDQITLGLQRPAAQSFSIDNPDYSRPPYVLDPSVYNLAPANVNNLRHILTQGVLVSERMTMFDDRLQLYAGGRYDRLAFDVENRLTGTFSESTSDGTTVQTGLVGRATDWLSAFANYSESFTPQAVNVTAIDPDGVPLENQDGSGREFGVKAAPFGGRLSFTLGYYDIEKTNIPRPAFTSSGVPIPVPGTTLQAQYAGDQRTQGWELDASWQPTDSLQFTVGYGRNNARWTRDRLPANRTLVGTSPSGAPRENLGVTGQYAFRTGVLKGLSLRAAVRYQARSVYSSDFRDANLAPILLYHPGFVVWDGGLGYEWQRGRSASHRVDLNVRNAFDVDYYVGRVAQQPRSLFLSYEVRFR